MNLVFQLFHFSMLLILLHLRIFFILLHFPSRIFLFSIFFYIFHSSISPNIFSFFYILSIQMKWYVKKRMDSYRIIKTKKIALCIICVKGKGSIICLAHKIWFSILKNLFVIGQKMFKGVNIYPFIPRLRQCQVHLKEYIFSGVTSNGLRKS